ncbi:fasciclin domain-containing protein [Aquabacterium sp. A3]|uniref:fasciclin domain-containing protein n=1 Tax=Aquabacterium sp. A3 TaxID=3132829 RepID=UPI00311A158D
MTFHRVSQHTLMAAALAASIVFAGCATHRAPAQPANLAAAAMQESELSTFNQLVQQAGMQDALQGSAPMTVFAPTNEAFKALPSATLEALSKNPDELRKVLKHHVVPGVHTQASIQGAVMMSTVADTKLPISKAGDYLTVESGLVIKGDIQTSNGVLHIIDAVALPPKPKK